MEDVMELPEIIEKSILDLNNPLLYDEEKVFRRDLFVNCNCKG